MLATTEVITDLEQRLHDMWAIARSDAPDKHLAADRLLEEVVNTLAKHNPGPVGNMLAQVLGAYAAATPSPVEKRAASPRM